MKKKIAILGSTGSIGRQTLEVVSMFPDVFEVELLTANQSLDLFLRQVEVVQPKWAFLHDEKSNEILKQQITNSSIQVLNSDKELFTLLEEAQLDVVVLAYVGIYGLLPAYHVVKSGKKLALANKEVLVSGGEFIVSTAQKTEARILPIDSEHSAIFQCLIGEDRAFIHKLIITASGGPFWGKKREALAEVSLEEALSHPTWKMGNKITIDSATMMNKGFEVIEAHWLFGIPAKQIDVLVHPQSIVHSIVQFIDGSFKAQLSFPDMRIPILYALSYPERFYAPALQQNIYDLPKLEFAHPDMDVFLHLKMAYQALEKGTAACCVLNAANDYAVSLFLEKKIRFLEMQSIVEKALEKLGDRKVGGIEEILDLYEQTVIFCKSLK